MTTINELIYKYNLPEISAKQSYSYMLKRIGYMNGVNKITDIDYLDDLHKQVQLTCTECGNISYQVVRKGKWNKVRKTCPCQKMTRERCKKAEIEKSRKAKKASWLNIGLRHIGKIYGDYEIVGIDATALPPKATAKCTICGEETSVSIKTLQNDWKSCVCHKHYNPIKFDESYIGKKNNRLTIIGIDESERRNRKSICKCDCGNIVEIKPTFWETGVTKSCGCLAEERKLEHTPELDRLRRIYNGMIQRCYNPNSVAYKHYGDRGIYICDEWLNDREKFIEWALSHGYSNDLSIDRINNDGIYEPGNCRWADAVTQANNQRKGDKRKKPVYKPTIEFRGKMYKLVELCEMFDTSEPAIRYRMNKMGMTLEDALTTPKKCEGRPRKVV